MIHREIFSSPAENRGRIRQVGLGRIDLHVEVSRPKSFLLEHEDLQPESSQQVRERVIAARKIQLQRAGQTNAQMDESALKLHCHITPSDRDLLQAASKQHALSPRACLRILKVARTLADLEAETEIGTAHVAEAISYRNCRAMRTF